MLTVPGRKAWIAALLLGLAGAGAMAQTDPPFIYAIHDNGGESLMGANRGWIVFTVTCWDAPRDYRTWSNQGYGVIVRLNNGYDTAGTLPLQANLGPFATRCGDYVAGSPGVNYWIIANEPNLSREWPESAPGQREAITVARYVNAYNQVWSAIRARVGTAKIAPAPAGTYAGADGANGIPMFRDYWQQVITQIPASRIQALIIHAYTHGCTTDLPASNATMASLPGIYYHFRVYRNYLAAVPTALKSLPVLITETDQTNEVPSCSVAPRAWYNVNTGWVRNIYAETNSWNQTAGNQKIRAVAMFRWTRAYEGNWTYGFDDLQGVKDDFTQAVASGYRWDTGGGSCTASVPSTSWKGEYFPNLTLSGTPSLVRNDGTGNLNFNWGTGGPNTCGIGSDNFSVRWTRTVSFSAGTWRFSVTSDDGFRLYVDGALKLDKWFDQAPTTYTVDVALTAASHTVRLDWYEKGGGATAQLSWALVGSGGGNNASILTGQSSVPSSLSPGQIAQVRVRVQNTGGTTWTAANLYRLGSQPTNQFTWRDFNCGGYNNNPGDARAFLCNNVGPSGTYDFVFNIQAPSSSGSYTFSVRMVQDGVQWFGGTGAWTISVGSSNPYPSCPCTAGYDNYCNHPPRTNGCPMTFGGGYCDPNGDLSYSDADWVRGYYEFQDYCR